MDTPETTSAATSPVPEKHEQLRNAKIQAFIWDVDGTIANSEPLHMVAWEQALAEHGCSLDAYPGKAQIAGKKPLKIAEELVEYFKLDIEPQALFDLKNHLFMELIEEQLEPMPGLPVALERLHRLGYVQAIASSMTAEYVRIVLKRFQIEHYFTVVATGEAVPKDRGKPHPDMFQLVARELGFDPSVCVVVEDAENGVAAANAAGCYCIAIMNPEAVGQNLENADQVVTSLAEIDETMLEELVEKRAAE